jgi:hypothetical protein
VTVQDYSNPVPVSSQVNNSKEPRITIIRTPHDDERPYFSMNRNTAQDRSLSWEARGVLAYLLSKPSDWKVMIADLKQNCGRDKVRKILTELKVNGYMAIGQSRDERGHFTGEYQVYETPITENQLPDTSNRKPVTGKQPLHNIDTKLKKQSSPRKRDEMLDAIAKVWGNNAGGWVGHMKNMLTGTAKTGEWARCNFTPPVTDAQEILDFEIYMKRRMTDKKLSDKPTACVTIQRWFYDFRNERDNPRNVLSVLDGLRIVS